MPYWLKRQLLRAFISKDIKQIRILNDCWYLYHKTQPDAYHQEKKANQKSN